MASISNPISSPIHFTPAWENSLPDEAGEQENLITEYYQKYLAIYSSEKNYNLIDPTTVINFEGSVETVLKGKRPLAEWDFPGSVIPPQIAALKKIQGIKVLDIPTGINWESTAYIIFREGSDNMAQEFAACYLSLQKQYNMDFASGTDSDLKAYERILNYYQKLGRFFHYTEDSIQEFGKKMTKCFEEEKARLARVEKIRAEFTEKCFQKYAAIYSPEKNYTVIDPETTSELDGCVETVLKGMRPLATWESEAGPMPPQIAALKKIHGIKVIELCLGEKLNGGIYLIFREESSDFAQEFADYHTSLQKQCIIDEASGNNSRQRAFERGMNSYQKMGRFFHYTEESILEFGKKIAKCFEMHKA